MQLSRFDEGTRRLLMGLNDISGMRKQKQNKKGVKS
jgi:hypothetical protein